MNWFYFNEAGEVVGPLSEETLRELHASGRLAATTQVCREGSEDWISLAEALGTFTATPAGGGESVVTSAAPTVINTLPQSHRTPGSQPTVQHAARQVRFQGGGTIRQATPPRSTGKKWALILGAIGGLAAVIVGFVFVTSKHDRNGGASSPDLVGNEKAHPKEKEVAKGPRPGKSQDAQGPSGDIFQSRVSTKAVANGPRPDKSQNPQGPSGDIFQSRVSTKADVLGLRGGMSKEETGKILGWKRLQIPPLTANNSAALIPGFQVFTFKPDESFPIKDVDFVDLAFLNDRLQSVCYVLGIFQCTVFRFKGGRTLIEHYGSILGKDHRVGRISDLRAAIKESFDITDQTLYPDFSSGRSIPKGGSYSVEHEDDMKGKGATCVDAVNPIFSAASSEIFVRFSGAVKNFDEIVFGLVSELNRPNMLRAEGRTKEYFLLRFSFRNTYSESLAAGEAQLAKEANKAAEEAAKRNEREGAEKAAKDRAEEARIRKLKDGF